MVKAGLFQTWTLCGQLKEIRHILAMDHHPFQTGSSGSPSNERWKPQPFSHKVGYSVAASSSGTSSKAQGPEVRLVLKYYLGIV